jgi:hypothetical protein
MAETPEQDAPEPATAPVPATTTVASPLPPVPTPNIDTGYTDAGVPTLDGVREKIENRYGTALGATELAEDTPEVRDATDQYESRHKAAAEKLEEIRASMHKPD